MIKEEFKIATLADTIEEALPLNWKLFNSCSVYSERGIGICRRFPPRLMFSVFPEYDTSGELSGIIIYPQNEGYRLARKFAKLFNDYHSRKYYNITLKKPDFYIF